jgi:predicted kinase
MGYLVEAHIKEECMKRNELRERKVPVFVIDRHFEQWQEPEFDEGFDQIINVMSDGQENVPSKPRDE